MTTEPAEAFPYLPPSPELRARYPEVFALTAPLPEPLWKAALDRFFAGALLVVFSPVLLFLFALNFLEGILRPENRGPLFYFYWSVSAGERFKKWKLRQTRMSTWVEPYASQHDWRGFSSEWDESARTLTGALAKKFYFDEIPQFFAIASGRMSLIGPRPLAVHHYERDLAQGNVCRRWLKGGLLGLGHIHKGTALMGSPEFEYEYAEIYRTRPGLGLFLVDMRIIFKGVLLVLKGGGH